MMNETRNGNWREKKAEKCKFWLINTSCDESRVGGQRVIGTLFLQFNSTSHSFARPSQFKMKSYKHKNMIVLGQSAQKFSPIIQQTHSKVVEIA